MSSQQQRQHLQPAAAAGGSDLDSEGAGGTFLTIAGPSPSCNMPPSVATTMEQSPQVLCLASLPQGSDPTPSPSEKQNSAQKLEQKVSLSGVRLDGMQRYSAETMVGAIHSSENVVSVPQVAEPVGQPFCGAGIDLPMVGSCSSPTAAISNTCPTANLAVQVLGAPPSHESPKGGVKRERVSPTDSSVDSIGGKYQHLETSENLAKGYLPPPTPIQKSDPTLLLLEQLSERLEQYQNAGEESFPRLDAPRDCQVGELNPTPYHESESDTSGDGENMAQDNQNPWYVGVDDKLQELDLFTKNLQEQISQSHLNISASVVEFLKREAVMNQEQFAKVHEEAQTGFLTSLSALEQVHGQDAVVHVAQQALQSAAEASSRLRQLFNTSMDEFQGQILKKVETMMEEKFKVRLGHITQGWALQFGTERAEVDKKIKVQDQNLQLAVNQLWKEVKKDQDMNSMKFAKMAEVLAQLGAISTTKVPAVPMPVQPNANLSTRMDLDPGMQASSSVLGGGQSGFHQPPLQNTPLPMPQVGPKPLCVEEKNAISSGNIGSHAHALGQKVFSHPENVFPQVGNVAFHGTSSGPKLDPKVVPSPQNVFSQVGNVPSPVQMQNANLGIGIPTSVPNIAFPSQTQNANLGYGVHTSVPQASVQNVLPTPNVAYPVQWSSQGAVPGVANAFVGAPLPIVGNSPISAPSAVVSTITSGNPYAGVANSFLATTHPLPEIFTGMRSDWPDWKRRWETYASVLGSAGSGGVPDAFLLSRLESVLDPPSRAELRSMSEMGMTYLPIWAKICNYFERDCEETSRSAWENLSLNFKGKLTSYEWRAYAAKFLTLMRRTPGATEGEGLRLLRKQLPSSFGEKIEGERARRRGTGRSLLLGGLDLNVSESTIATWLVPVTGFGASRIWREKEFFAVECCNDSQRSKLLSLNGCLLDNGGILKVLPKDSDLNVQGAIDLVSELIERRERVEEAKSPSSERQPRDSQRSDKNTRTIEFEGPRSPSPNQLKGMFLAKKLAIEGAIKSLESPRPNSPARSTSSGKGGEKGKGKGGGGGKNKNGRWKQKPQGQPKTQENSSPQQTQQKGGKGQDKKGQNDNSGRGGRGGGPSGGQ